MVAAGDAGEPGANPRLSRNGKSATLTKKRSQARIPADKCIAFVFFPWSRVKPSEGR